MAGTKLHCQKGDDQASGGVDGAQNYSTHSVSVTVGTTHPQRFLEGSFEGQRWERPTAKRGQREVKGEKQSKHMDK